MAGGTLVIQGGSFENTAALATKQALSLGGGVAEFRGGTVVDGAVSIGPTMSATISADGSPIDTTLVKSPGSDVFLVEGTQGPLTSTVCGIGPTVPALSTWALGLTVTALAAAGAAFQRRLRHIA